MKLTKRALAPLVLTGLMVGSCGVANAYSITATTVPPMNLMDFGTSTTQGLQSGISSPINEPGVSISFSGPSGVYAGNVTNVVASPFGSETGPDYQNYLSAEPNGTLTLSYSSNQTAFDLLWGTVDNYNGLTLTLSGGGGSGSTTISGADIAGAIGGITLGRTNQAVNISGLPSFDTISVSSTTAAFEFVPASVPEPGTLALMGLGLLGLCVVRFRRSEV